MDMMQGTKALALAALIFGGCVSDVGAVVTGSYIFVGQNLDKFYPDSDNVEIVRTIVPRLEYIRTHPNLDPKSLNILKKATDRIDPSPDTPLRTKEREASYVATSEALEGINLHNNYDSANGDAHEGLPPEASDPCAPWYGQGQWKKRN